MSDDNGLVLVQRAGPGLRSGDYLSDGEKSELQSYARRLAESRSERNVTKARQYAILSKMLSAKGSKSTSKKEKNDLTYMVFGALSGAAIAATMNQIRK